MALTVKDTANMLALKKRMESLTAGDQLRLCAELVDRGDEGSLAIVETLVGRVIDTLRETRLLGIKRG